MTKIVGQRISLDNSISLSPQFTVLPFNDFSLRQLLDESNQSGMV